MQSPCPNFDEGLAVNALDLFRLDGKVALVTGARRGLGQAIALALAEAGASIVGVNRSSDAEETRQQVTALGRRYLTIQADLEKTTVQDLTDIVNRTVVEMGRLDILVNNAGIIRRIRALDYSENDWDAVMQINLKSAFFLAQAAARLMVSQGRGKIINVASVLSYQGGILVPPYTASKSAIMGLTRALANEWASLGVNVNAIVPGYFATDNTDALRADESRNAAILARIPAGRWGHPEDLKGAALYLASAASDYMHGAAIVVDGGWLAR
jgi:2-deoxy-D-gluconate 3-dehydrogenase